MTHAEQFQAMEKLAVAKWRLPHNLTSLHKKFVTWYGSPPNLDNFKQRLQVLSDVKHGLRRREFLPIADSYRDIGRRTSSLADSYRGIANNLSRALMESPGKVVSPSVARSLKPGSDNEKSRRVLGRIVIRGDNRSNPYAGGYSSQFVHGTARPEVARHYGRLVENPDHYKNIINLHAYKSLPNQMHFNDWSLEKLQPGIIEAVRENSYRPAGSWRDKLTRLVLMDRAPKTKMHRPAGRVPHQEGFYETPVFRDNPYLGSFLFDESTNRLVNHKDLSAKGRSILKQMGYYSS